MPVPVKKQVLRLQVAINDFERVKIVESEGDFGGVKLGDWIGESLHKRGEQLCQWMKCRWMNIPEISSAS